VNNEELKEMIRRGIDDVTLRRQVLAQLERKGKTTRVQRLFVPCIGDKMRLTHDWTFRLYWEDRNDKLIVAWKVPFFRNRETGEMEYLEKENRWRHYRYVNDKYERAEYVEVTLPAGTILITDRVYIRQGGDDYASLTFRSEVGVEVESKRGRKKTKMKKVRFWAKLGDVNRILFEHVEEPS